MQSTITQYIRDKKNQKKGLFMAVKKGKSVKISWSLTHSQMDKFDRDHAHALTAGRIMLNKAPVVPRSIKSELNQFKQRTKTYFTNCTVEVIGE